VSVTSLLNHLTAKFTRLLNYIKEQEKDRAALQAELEDAQTYIHQQASNLMKLRKDAAQSQYERDQMMQTLQALRKRVQERVPVISVVEERRLELE